MPLNCPVCRASNEQGPNCRRCKADLSMLFTIEAQRAQLVASARAAIADGRLVFAARSVWRANELRGGADLARLSAVIALLRRDFAQARNEYHRAVHTTSET
jgi:hypothetical protein